MASAHADVMTDHLETGGGNASSPDHTLVAQAKAGCLPAFALLVERYYAALLRSLTRQLRDAELAGDLAQQTFLDAFRHLDRFQDDRPFAAWLFRIARNHVLMEWRRRQRCYVSLDGLLDQSARSLPVSPADSLAACHERDMVEQVLDQLSPALRRALLLHSLAGFPTHDVARLLGIAPEAARKRIGRAKAQFRVRYRQLNDADCKVATGSH